MKETRKRNVFQAIVLLSFLSILLFGFGCSSSSNSGGGGNPPILTGLGGTASGSLTLLFQLDEMTGTSTRLTGFGLGGFQNVAGLAYDANTDTLYGVNRTTAQLITIDPATGAGTAVGSTGALMSSLAFL